MTNLPLAPTDTTSSATGPFSPYSSYGGVNALSPGSLGSGEVVDLDLAGLNCSPDHGHLESSGELSLEDLLFGKYEYPHPEDPKDGIIMKYRTVTSSDSDTMNELSEKQITKKLNGNVPSWNQEILQKLSNCSPGKSSPSDQNVESNKMQHSSPIDRKSPSTNKRKMLTSSQHILRTKTKTVQVTEYFLINESKNGATYHQNLIQEFENNSRGLDAVQEATISSAQTKYDGDTNRKSPLIFLPDVLCNCKLTYEKMVSQPSFLDLFRVYNVYFVDWPLFLEDAQDENMVDYSMEGFIDDFGTVMEWIEIQERSRGHRCKLPENCSTTQRISDHATDTKKSKVTMICTGTGAYISMLWTLRNPSTVKYLLLSACVSDSCGWKEWMGWRFLLFRLKYSGLSTTICNDFLNFLLNTNHTDNSVRNTFSAYLKRINHNNLCNFYEAWIRRENISDRLRNMNVKTVIFVGEQSASLQQSKATYTSILPTLSSIIIVRNSCNLIAFESPMTIVRKLYALLQGDDKLNSEL